MKSERFAMGLTALNLVLLLFVLVPQLRPSQAQEVVPVLRGRALELVDEAGQIRSRINVEPDGEVVFRLTDRKGTIRVKLGAGESGSGLLLLDEATEPAVHVIARRTGTPERPTTTSVTLRGAAGEQRVLKP